MRSMSRASFLVLMWRISGPPLRTHASAILRDQFTFSVMPPPTEGQGLSRVGARSSWARSQLTGVLWPIPRRSKLTRS